MQRFLFAIDRFSARIGTLFGWAIVILMLAVCYDVGMRYIFRAPTDWAFDAAYILYGTLFMMAGAYTLSRNGHVRGDVLYGYMPARVQAGMDLLLYLLFFTPGIAAMIYFGVDFARLSWKLNEHSSQTSGGPPLYHFKALITIAGTLIMIQGVAEMMRCVICIREGKWPNRLHDVEEVEVDKLKQMVHFDESVLAEADQALLAKQAQEAKEKKS